MLQGCCMKWLCGTNKMENVESAVPFVPPIQEGFVIKVYDGDTITIVSKLPYSKSPLYKFQVRLAGIDCPEIRGNTESEKQCAQLAKKFVENLVLKKTISLHVHGNDKYGRILADVFVGNGNEHVNQLLLEEHLAVIYDGGTKKCPADWMEYYNGEIIQSPL